MKNSLLTLFFLLTQFAIGQNMEKVRIQSTDPYHLYVNDAESTELFYFKIVPAVKPIAVLTIIPSGGQTIEDLLQQISLHTEAAKKGLLVIIPSINWGTDNRAAEISLLDSIFKQVVKEHNVDRDKFIFCGLSNGGMISMSYAINAVKESNTFIVPLGIIGLDPPLDFTRFYKYCEREIERNFSEAGVGEAKWMLNNYQRIYGGAPEQNPQAYIDASSYSFGVEGGGNAIYLNNIAIRMHSDLNTDFLINQRRRDLHDWNGIDAVSFVNQLKLNGNKNAQIVITHNKGVRPDGSKNPHSWSIMDTDDTIEWIMKLVD